MLCGFFLLREPFVLVLTLENSRYLGLTWLCIKSNDNQLINWFKNEYCLWKLNSIWIKILVVIAYNFNWIEFIFNWIGFKYNWIKILKYNSNNIESNLNPNPIWQLDSYSIKKKWDANWWQRYWNLLMNMVMKTFF